MYRFLFLLAISVFWVCSAFGHISGSHDLPAAHNLNSDYTHEHEGLEPVTLHPNNFVVTVIDGIEKGRLTGTHKHTTTRDQVDIDAHLADNDHDWFPHQDHNGNGNAHDHDYSHNHDGVGFHEHKPVHTHTLTHTHEGEGGSPPETPAECRSRCIQEWVTQMRTVCRSIDDVEERIKCNVAARATRKSCQTGCDSANAPSNPHLQKKVEQQKRTLTTTWASLKMR